MHRPVHIVILVMAMAQSSPVSAQALDVDEPSGYRMKAFRADVPDTLTGATVVDTRQAEKLWRQGSTVFLDVLPRPVKPNNLPKSTVWRDKKRETIPGSFWLPNVGYGRLHPTMQDYFKNHLERLTQNDLTRPVLFYCLDRCWMSWNAAKRALEYGYSHVYWYPKGTDGWSLDGLPLEEKLPEE